MSRCKLALPALAVSMFAGLLFAAPSSAAVPQFACLARAVTGPLVSSPGTFDPTTQTDTRCTDAARTSAGPATFGPLRVGAAGAYTHSAGPRQAPGSGALASLTNFHLSIPGEQIVIETAQAQSSFACLAGTLQGVGSSEVSGVSINGGAVSLPNGSETAQIKLDTRGSYLLLNKQIRDSTEVTRTAAVVHLVGVGDYTIAQAQVLSSGGPCVKTHAFPPSVQPCPVGSVYDPTTQQCLITVFTKRPILIAAPFQGPTGVSVDSLSLARSSIKGSHCMRGAGPSYAMIGSPAGGGLVTGTRGADRILTLSGTFTIEGNGGKDCISTGSGTNTIHDGNAKLRVYGGFGSNHITVGNGNDRIVLKSGTNVVHAGGGKDYIRGALGFNKIFVGNGNDRIVLSGPGIAQVTAGNGNDYVHGGAGSSRISLGNGNSTIIGGAGFSLISAGNGANSIFAGPGIARISAGKGNDVIHSAVGFDRISARGPGAKISCVDRAQVVVNPAAVAYARAHHCVNVIAR